MHPFLEQQRNRFRSAVDHFQKELSGLRTGIATPALVEEIPVPAYDSIMELKGLASTTVQDSKTLLINAWDKGLLQAIEKAIRDAGIGVSPVVDGDVIRIVMPPMTEENRKQIVKLVKEKLEEARISIRGVRESVRDEVIKIEKAKEIGEDEKFKQLDELDKYTKEITQEVEVMAKTKEEEIMTV